jgi:hypothetical protein
LLSVRKPRRRFEHGYLRRNRCSVLWISRHGSRRTSARRTSLHPRAGRRVEKPWEPEAAELVETSAEAMRPAVVARGSLCPACACGQRPCEPARPVKSARRKPLSALPKACARSTSSDARRDLQTRSAPASSADAPGACLPFARRVSYPSLRLTHPREFTSVTVADANARRG